MGNRDYSVSQLAQLAGVARQSVQQAINKDRLPGAYKAGNTWIIPKAAGDAYIEKRGEKKLVI